MTDLQTKGERNKARESDEKKKPRVRFDKRTEKEKHVNIEETNI